MTTQMHKNAALNEAKKPGQKAGNNLNQASGLRAKGLYKTMIKPGAISSQSFLHAPDCTTTTRAG